MSKQAALSRNVHQVGNQQRLPLPQLQTAVEIVAQDVGLDLDRRLAVILSLAPQANNLPKQLHQHPQMNAQTAE